MKIFELEAESGRKWVWFFTVDGPVTPNTFDETVEFFEKKPRIRIDRNTESTPKSSRAKLSDYSNLDYAHMPVFSERAKQVLGPHIDAFGLWLKLECDEAPYWLFNITNVVDGLDEKKSELARFRDGGVMAIDRFVFHPERLRGQRMFMVPQRPLAYNLVTDEFVKLVEQHNLTGFSFKLLWSDEAQPLSAAA
ncbi:imm11 family protein [Piscinibacter sp.]|uniref:imm11 family protein n=1 Tax=Piscinibacter sp. TaxID=1903157 RepID=UPI002BF5208F|nr:DUF1629 domain-containing protein [Albitalea sp.]HUG23538.1 DUF1629 domain-containing protein [Albitalea sp.]